MITREILYLYILLRLRRVSQSLEYSWNKIAIYFARIVPHIEI